MIPPPSQVIMIQDEGVVQSVTQTRSAARLTYHKMYHSRAGRPVTAITTHGGGHTSDSDNFHDTRLSVEETEWGWLISNQSRLPSRMIAKHIW